MWSCNILLFLIALNKVQQKSFFVEDVIHAILNTVFPENYLINFQVIYRFSLEKTAIVNMKSPNVVLLCLFTKRKPIIIYLIFGNCR